MLEGKYLQLEELDRRILISDIVELLSKSDDFYDIVESEVIELKRNGKIKVDNKDPREFKQAIQS